MKGELIKLIKNKDINEILCIVESIEECITLFNIYLQNIKAKLIEIENENFAHYKYYKK